MPLLAVLTGAVSLFLYAVHGPTPVGIAALDGGSRESLGEGRADGLAEDPAEELLVVPPATNLDALELHLLGRHHWHQRTASSLDRALDYFSQALDLDPMSALAHSGMADAYLLQANSFPAGEDQL
ncbi:MAG: hypothetical protein O7G86_15460, partial [Gammaproteobacteria bacterium]|nr:hypothetical protein [Gammaproteobacteria bacterium]